MKIDRERFLLVLGLLAAAGACTSKATSNAPGEDAGTGTDAGGGTDTGATQGGQDSGHDSAPVILGDGGLFPYGWDGGCLGTSGGDTTACAPFETVEPEGGLPAGEDGGPPCITLDLCESVSAVAAGVAAQILACEKIDTSPTCARTTACVLAALSIACPSATAPTTCAPVVAACADAGVSVDGGAGAITESQCEQLVAGFNTSTLQTLTNCLSSSCDVRGCVSSLF